VKKSTTILVDIPVQGRCVTRNGESIVCRMTAEVLTTEESSAVSIGFVSNKLHRSLHAGATLTVKSVDDFCESWLKSRSKKGHTLNGMPDVGLTRVLVMLREAEEILKRSKKVLSTK